MRAVLVCARVAVLVVLVSACSSGGGHGPDAAHSSAAVKSAVSSSQVVAKLGPCPTQYPLTSVTSLTTLNAGVPGLDKRLVPIAALNVRVCEYDVPSSATTRLRASGSLKPVPVPTFERETNRLPKRSVAPSCAGTTRRALTEFLLTFANKSRSVSLEAYGTCQGGVNNGHFYARPTRKWLKELTISTTKHRKHR